MNFFVLPLRLIVNSTLSPGRYLLICSCKALDDLIFTPFTATITSPFSIPASLAELRSAKPPKTDLHGWIFGCDACQSLCPWNRRAPQHRNAAFDAVFDPLAMDAATWLGMDEAAFEALCGRTPLTRSGLTRIRENALRNAAPEEPSEC